MAAGEAEAWRRDAAQLMGRLEAVTEETARLVPRLEAAERVCAVFGWTAASSDSDQDKALHELWAEWVAIVGSEFASPAAHPELGEERITELARRRDLTRRRTLDAIRKRES